MDANILATLNACYKENDRIKGAPLAGLHHATGSYLDLLTFLREHGWKIIVPEMVAKEIAQIIVGKNIARMLHSDPKYYGEKNTQAFCQHSPRQIRQAALPAPGESDSYRSYLYELREAVGLALPEARKKAIYQVEIRYKDKKKDFGDYHCFDVIEEEILKQRKSGAATPIIFFSSDGNAREMLREKISHMKQAGDSPVHLLAPDGLLSALASDLTPLPFGDAFKVFESQAVILRDDPQKVRRISALALLGLSGTVQSHWQHIKKTLPKCNKLREEFLGDNGYHDSPLEAYGTGRYPFAEAVRGLAEELVEERQKAAAEQAESQKAAPKPPSRLEMFRQQALKTKKLQAARTGNGNGGGMTH